MWVPLATAWWCVRLDVENPWGSWVLNHSATLAHTSPSARKIRKHTRTYHKSRWCNSQLKPGLPTCDELQVAFAKSTSWPMPTVLSARQYLCKDWPSEPFWSGGFTLGLKPLNPVIAANYCLDLLHSLWMAPNLNVVLVHLCTSLGTMIPILQKYAWAQNPPEGVVCALVPSALLAAGVCSWIAIFQLRWRCLSGLHSCQKHLNRSLSCKVASWKTMKEMP